MKVWPPTSLWLAVRVGAWLCWLPLLLHLHPLPALLQRLSSVGERNHSRTPFEFERAVKIVIRVCRLRLFHLSIFPRACLRQSLALYRVLRQMGYAVEIHIGVRKVDGTFLAHSWVTYQGAPVAESDPLTVYKPLYSYPATGCHAIPDKLDNGLTKCAA